MDNLLFKLKKDGKTVGYLKLADGWTQFQSLGRNDWYYPCDFKWTSAHPFVTTDKNGKDVFDGDRVKRVNGEPCFVEWFTEECRYVLHNNQNYYDIDVLELEQGIELIEDSK